MSSLPYCPNCRNDLPDVIESWICNQPLEVPVSSATIATDDFGSNFQFTEDGSVNDAYQDEDKICERFNATGDTCTGCNEKKKKGLFDVVCPSPKCGMELPNLTNVICRTITVTGPAGSGKSHYIMALHTWWSRQLSAFGLVAVPAMGRRLRAAFKQFQSQVLRNKRRLEATRKGRVISFSWNIKPTSGPGPGILVTLPDVSGEGLMNARTLIANRHYNHASGVLFLIDANRIIFGDNPDDEPGVANRDPADHFEVAEAMISDFERRLTPEEMRNIPIAVCVNKLDKLRGHDQRWDQIAKDYIPAHNGFFDIRTCHERSEHIREILFGDPDLSPALGLIEASFDSVMYFVMATIGSDSENLQLMPVAVEDPFLYQLWHLNFVHANDA